MGRRSRAAVATRRARRHPAVVRRPRSFPSRSGPPIDGHPAAHGHSASIGPSSYARSARRPQARRSSAPTISPTRRSAPASAVPRAHATSSADTGRSSSAFSPARRSYGTSTTSPCPPTSSLSGSPAPNLSARSATPPTHPHVCNHPRSVSTTRSMRSPHTQHRHPTLRLHARASIVVTSDACSATDRAI